MADSRMPTWLQQAQVHVGIQPDGRTSGSAWLTRLGVEIGIAGSAIIVAVVARIAIEQVVGGVAPFVLTFPVVMAATLAAGARAGIMAAVGCQLLTIQFVFPNWTAAHGGEPTNLANLILSSLTLAGMIWATAAYRRTGAQLRLQCEQQVETLSLLVVEMDHRTKNNFQIAAALLLHQARATDSRDVEQELTNAATRLSSIASMYRNLIVTNQRAGAIDLADYLSDIAALLRHGAMPDGVQLSFRGDSIQVPAQTALIVGLLVNEWVTNSIKYAFSDGVGTVMIDAYRDGREIVVGVTDDGDGSGVTAHPGIGSRLIDGLARAIDARVECDRAHGTRCAVRLDAAA